MEDAADLRADQYLNGDGYKEIHWKYLQIRWVEIPVTIEYTYRQGQQIEGPEGQVGYEENVCGHPLKWEDTTAFQSNQGENTLCQ